MKITFEGTYYEDILTQMANILAVTARQTKKNELLAAAKSLPPEAQGPGPATPFEVIHVDKPVDKPLNKPGRTEKQKANDERLRERALAKKAAGLKVGDKTPLPTPPPLKTAEGMDPAEVVKVRQKTIEDLQQAYANGHQQEVFELLSRFGNGAKSFRELPPEAFMPIRQAIDNGALA